MNRLPKIILLAVTLMLPAVATKAQQTLSVDTVFYSLGRQKGSVLINLMKEVLEKHSKIEHYKCLMITSNPAVEKQIVDAVDRDFAREGKRGNTLVIKEIKKDGIYKTFYFCVGIQNTSLEREYILYKTTDGKITLIYLKGQFISGDLDRELKNLKKLFIKLNNKQITL
jgi:hypothetical protein